MLYYVIFIISTVLGSVNNAWLMKKYQMTAGTGLYANVLFMIINGLVSALVSIVVLIVRHETFQATPYSLIMAIVTVLCAAMSTLSVLKGYEVGHIAIVNVFSVMGSILLSCLWGLLFLNESISTRQVAAIALIIAAILLFTLKHPEHGKAPLKNPKEASAKTGKHRLLWLYLLIFVTAGFVNIFSKLHQVEKNYAAVNTLSFSIWIGMVRAIIFTLFLPFLKYRHGHLPKMPKASYTYATAISAVGGACYIVTLTVVAVLPLTITSPLSTGISMGLTSFLPWLLYREKLRKQEIAGIVLSILGILLYT